MRVHFILNHGTPDAKLADVELFFETGLLQGLKLVGTSIWKTKKGDALNVLVPARSYVTGGTTRYFDLLRSETNDDRTAIENFKTFIKDEYAKLVASEPKAAAAN